MGVAKKKSATKKGSSKGSSLGAIKSAAKGILGGGSRGGRRRSRVTPERLARKILILKLQKKLYRLKYGGR